MNIDERNFMDRNVRDHDFVITFLCLFQRISSFCAHCIRCYTFTQ